MCSISPTFGENGKKSQGVGSFLCRAVVVEESFLFIVWERLRHVPVDREEPMEGRERMIQKTSGWQEEGFQRVGSAGIGVWQMAERGRRLPLC